MDGNYWWGLLAGVVGTAAGFQGVYERYNKDAYLGAVTRPGIGYLLSRAIIPAGIFVGLVATKAIEEQFWWWALVVGTGTEAVLRSKFFVRRTATDPPEDVLWGPFDLVKWYQELFLAEIGSHLSAYRIALAERLVPSRSFPEFSAEIASRLDGLTSNETSARLLGHIDELRAAYDQSAASDRDTRFCIQLIYRLQRDVNRREFHALLARPPASPTVDDGQYGLAGALSLGLGIVFLMALILLPLFGKTAPCDARGLAIALLAAVLSLGIALTSYSLGASRVRSLLSSAGMIILIALPGYYWYVRPCRDGITWQAVNRSAPWGPRGAHVAVAHDGALWVLGGASMQDESDPGVRLHRGAFEFREGRRLWLGGHNDVWRSEDGVSWRLVGRAPWTPRLALHFALPALPLSTADELESVARNVTRSQVPRPNVRLRCHSGGQSFGAHEDEADGCGDARRGSHALFATASQTSDGLCVVRS